MFTVAVEEAILEKLRQLLADEDDDCCVRLREYKVGGGWKAKFVLGLSMDEADEDEDASIAIDDISFIAEKDFLSKYGTAFVLAIGEDGNLVLTVA